MYSSSVLFLVYTFTHCSSKGHIVLFNPLQIFVYILSLCRLRLLIQNKINKQITISCPRVKAPVSEKSFFKILESLSQLVKY